MIFEICIDSVEAAVAAEKAGAQRVELCDDLVEGGTTPSLGMIQVVRKTVSIDVNVMIRPRGGDFVYSPEEYEVMKHDIAAAKQAGASGVVFGMLLPDGRVDVERTRELTRLARPLSVTFHRAFDLCLDPYEALEALAEIGVDRILTSGHTARAVDGLDCLTRLVQQAGQRLIILIGGSVNATNVETIIRTTGCKEVHFAARKVVESPMTHRVPHLFMGSTYHPDEYSRKATDQELIARVIRAAG